MKMSYFAQMQVVPHRDIFEVNSRAIR